MTSTVSLGDEQAFVVDAIGARTIPVEAAIQRIALVLDHLDVAPNLAHLREIGRKTSIRESRDFASLVIASAPLEIIENKFGEELVFWASMSAYAEQRQMGEAYLKAAGYNVPALREAYFLLDSEPHVTPTFLTVVANAKIIEALTVVTSTSQSLASLITQVRFKESMQNAARAEKYSIQWHYDPHFDQLGLLHWTKHANSNQFSTHEYVSHPAAPFSFTLMYQSGEKAEPQHNVSFYANAANSLIINQWQAPSCTSGVDGSTSRWVPSGLGWFDHRQLHIKVLSGFARALSFEKLGIQSAANNEWTSRTYIDGRPHLPLERAKVLYDGAALRAGFVLNPSDGNFYLDIV